MLGGRARPRHGNLALPWRSSFLPGSLEAPYGPLQVLRPWLASRGCLLRPALPSCCWMWAGVRTGPGGEGGWSKLRQMDWPTDPADIKGDHVTWADVVWCFQSVAKIPPDCDRVGPQSPRCPEAGVCSFSHPIHRSPYKKSLKWSCCLLPTVSLSAWLSCNPSRKCCFCIENTHSW